MVCISVNVVGQPNIQVVDVTASTTNPQVGQSVTITARVTNTGTASGTANIDLFINGARQNMTKSVSLNPSASTTVSWNITFNNTGSYNVCVEVV